MTKRAGCVMKDLQSRREFLGRAAAVSAGIALGAPMPGAARPAAKLKTTDPKRALVTWFSQAGHTERIGKIVACRLIRAGLSVDHGDIRDVSLEGIAGYDLVVTGSPVYYFEAPDFLTARLEALTSIEGAAVASYSTYGGPGHNQHNTACDLLERLVDKGGVPVGMDTFGNMSTFAPTWSSGRIARVVKYRDRPNEATYRRARQFADGLLAAARAGTPVEVKRSITAFEAMKILNSRWWTKRMISRHEIDAGTCISCGLCEDRCPAGAITIARHLVDRDRCVACMGCVNLCPVQAHVMIFNGDRVYGFQELLRRQKIEIAEPEELRGDFCPAGGRR